MKKTIIIYSLKSKKMSIVIIGIVFHSLLFTNSFSQSGWVKQKIGYDYDFINVIHFFNQNTGYAISGYKGVPGYFGRFFKTTNGGQNWTSTNFNNADHFYEGHFFDETNFVLVGNRSNGFGIVAIYTNNIRNDILIPPVMSGAYETDIATTDWKTVDTGFIAGWDFGPGGAQPRALKTLNHGINWTEITPPINIVSSAIYNMQLDNLGNIYCKGDSKLIKTTNFGQNWNIISSSLSHFSFDIATVDTFYIYDYYFNVKISTDTGHTWQLRSIGTNINIGSIEFLNSKTGWVYGDTGYIFRTNNAGINWQRQYSGTRASLSCISIIDNNNVWIGGDSGIVLKTTSGGVSFINNNEFEIKNSFKLEQNYPNPFNPVTKIKYQISSLANVKIVVYDLLGREVETLVNEKQLAGEYEASFDGHNLNSGIYFYRIEAGSYVQVKRMVLIK